jgi:hypothetical protein
MELFAGGAIYAMLLSCSIMPQSVVLALLLVLLPVLRSTVLAGTGSSTSTSSTVLDY